MGAFSIICPACGTPNLMTQDHCLICKQPLPPMSDSTALSLLPTLHLPAHKMLKQQYSVLGPIGRGGMGTVYLAEDTMLGNRLVAIKEMSQKGLSPSEKRETARNFQREAHLLAGLQHPNLPSIYDHFAEQGRWYLVMSFIKGQTLAQYVKSNQGKLPTEEVIEIGLTLCNVLHYLHTHNPPIIFRDLKPTNIMRTPEGHIYLIDFGIARLFKQGQQKDTATYGSFGYAPPEQYGKAQTTERSDIYSMGATFYHLLSGYDPVATPFNLPPLSSLVPDVPEPLVALITRMLELNEKRRPQSVEEVKRDLQDIINRSQSREVIPESRQRERPAGSIRKTITAIVAALTLVILVASGLFIKSMLFSGASTANGAVTTFCNAMNSQNPDYDTAYNQLSSSYQSEHGQRDFEGYFHGATRCATVQPPNASNQATVDVTMSCPPPPGGGPPPDGDNGGPPLNGPPPQTINRLDLTVIHDGNNGWKINSIYAEGCNGPPPR